MSEVFSGAKIVLLRGRELVVYLRDEKPSIPFPGMWDLPGGGREGDETPERCVLREVTEEFGIAIPQERIFWRRRYPSWSSQNTVSFLFAAMITDADVAAIVFGDEGQRWQMMDIDAFLAHPGGVPHLQVRVRDFLAEAGV